MLQAFNVETKELQIYEDIKSATTTLAVKANVIYNHISKNTPLNKRIFICYGNIDFDEIATRTITVYQLTDIHSSETKDFYYVKDLIQFVKEEYNIDVTHYNVAGAYIYQHILKKTFRIKKINQPC